jgi:hypothetical protein
MLDSPTLEKERRIIAGDPNMSKIEKRDAGWRQGLPRETFEVARKGGTERAFDNDHRATPTGG